MGARSMDRIRNCAELSVRRACGFALLGIASLTLGMSGDPAQALETAAIGFGVMSLVLVVFALRAHRKPYRRREVWRLMHRYHGMDDESRAQETISWVMSQTFLLYAQRAAIPAWLLYVIDVGHRIGKAGVTF